MERLLSESLQGAASSTRLHSEFIQQSGGRAAGAERRRSFRCRVVEELQARANLSEKSGNIFTLLKFWPNNTVFSVGQHSHIQQALFFPLCVLPSVLYHHYYSLFLLFSSTFKCPEQELLLLVAGGRCSLTRSELLILTYCHCQGALPRSLRADEWILCGLSVDLVWTRSGGKIVSLSRRSAAVH